MNRIRTLLIVTLLVVVIGAPLAIATPTAAQGNSTLQGNNELQVWYYPGDEYQLGQVEYRDAAGNVLAWYSLASDSTYSPNQTAGLLAGYDSESLPIFSPYTGTIEHHVPSALVPPDGNVFYSLSQAIPSPAGTFAFSITKMNVQDQVPAESTIFMSAPGQATESVITQITSQDAWSAVQPLGWDDSGTRLLISDMPQGIGGYILFWTYLNVRTYDIGSGMMMSLGDLDGYADNLMYTARLQTNADYQPTGIEITNTATQQTSSYALPVLPETVSTGGGAVFSPNNTKVAYQVARQNPEQEKFYTVVLDLTTGQSRVVLEDESANYELRYGQIAGWMDDNTLVVGSAWYDVSAVVDATTGTLLREEGGAFLGYADGITSTGGFAPSGVAHTQCPDAPKSRLAANMRGRITYTDGTMTNVRYWAGLDADLAGQMAEGSTFTVLFGPSCMDGFAWWNLQFDSGLSGYVAEGTATDYYLEPWQ